MRNKLLFLTGIGVGYVLGTKAGRERYEQIRRTAQKVRENPTVQEATGSLQAQAGSLVSSAKDIANDKLGNTAIGAKVNSLLGSSSSSPAPTVTAGPATGTPSATTPRPAGSNGSLG
ncbi:YtxH domain-containing protein [Cryptosporangium phraense]|uniref:YtxH domain-containing protein n=1 Tax=Cryptosporangium phraense TaxID=2593070 RepID=A0A545AFC3_9ACTN|nr:YtxH domain-containing protein [Cryptosporangium phraense]TQS40024.1 hypothetical protein FL583_36945 [Cryptosporangium phraense]